MVKAYTFDDKEAQSGGNGADIQWLTIESGKPREVLLLSNISPKNVGADNFEMGRDMLVFRAWKPYKKGFTFKNTEGETQFVTLPILDIEEHSEEESVNPFVDIPALLGIKEQIKPQFLLWVQDAEDKQIYLYNPPISVTYQLNDLESNWASKKRALRGNLITINRKEEKSKTVYSTTGFPFGEPLDIEDIEYPCDLREIPLFRASNSIDKQIEFLNSIKVSVMQFLSTPEKTFTESMWPFDNENRVKAEFLGSDE